jgi:predicted RNA binding protein YcfA (HicA-like mRNA interferase family)
MAKTAVSDLLKSLEDSGYTVKRTKNNHWQVCAPGHSTVTISSTPSDKRGTLNIVSTLKRNGYTFTYCGRKYGE